MKHKQPDLIEHITEVLASLNAALTAAANRGLDLHLMILDSGSSEDYSGHTYQCLRITQTLVLV